MGSSPSHIRPEIDQGQNPKDADLQREHPKQGHYANNANQYQLATSRRAYQHIRCRE